MIASLKQMVQKNKDESFYTSWAWAWEGGYYATQKDAWLYKVCDTVPLVWGKDQVRQTEIDRVAQLFRDLAAKSKGTRYARFASRREFHLLSLRYAEMPDVSQETPGLRDFLSRHIYTDPMPRRLLVVGVKLQMAAKGGKESQTPEGEDSIYGRLTSRVDKISLDSPVSLENYKGDIAEVTRILFKHGFRDPTSFESSIIETWYSPSSDEISSIVMRPHSLEIDDPRGDNPFWTFRAATSWRQEIDPMSPWAARAMGHPHPAWCISMRGELEKSTATRKRINSQRRKMEDTLDQTFASGEFDRQEDITRNEAMEALEAHYAENTDEPSVAELSVVMARRLFPDPDNPGIWYGSQSEQYSDMLSESYGIGTAGLTYVQIDGLREFLPCAKRTFSSRRPFRHFTTLGAVAASGITNFSNLGDKKGAHLGYAEPEGVEVRCDFHATSSEDKTPITMIAGRPGSGKTVLSQFLIHQASQAKMRTVMINPKGADTLSPILTLTGGEQIELGARSRPGQLDPYRYAGPEEAAQILSGFISTIRTDLKDRDMARIDAGLLKSENAECAMQAIANINDSALRAELEELRDSNPIVGLCMGTEGGEFSLGQKGGMDSESEGVLLVEFGPDIQLPKTAVPLKEMERQERIGVGAVGMLMQAAIHLIIQARRGKAEGGTGSLLLIDEAWLMLLSPKLVDSYLMALGRLGRSLDVALILATQKVSDILDAKLKEFISRAVFLELASEEEQDAALDFLDLPLDSPSHREVLVSGGSKRYEDPNTGEVRRVPPTAWHKDIYGRTGVISLRLPEKLLHLYSTNPDDRKKLMKDLNITKGA